MEIDAEQLERAVPSLEPTRASRQATVPAPLKLSNTAQGLAETTKREQVSKEEVPELADARRWAEQFDWERSAIGPFDRGDRWEWIRARRGA